MAFAFILMGLSIVAFIFAIRGTYQNFLGFKGLTPQGQGQVNATVGG